MRQNALPLALALVAAAAGGIAYSGPARSEEAGKNLLNDTVSVSLGTFLLTTDTRVALNGSGGQQATEVNLKRDLGFSDTNRFRVDGSWRFFKRHKLRFMYFDTRQTRDKTLERTLTIGNTTYPVSAQVHSENSNKIAELAYEYAFWRGENYEVTGSIGVHTLKFKFGISGDGTVNGQAGQFSTETATTTAPLPVIGAHGLWQFQPQWYLDAQAQYFGLKVQNVDGHLTDLRVGVTRMFGEHFGIGAGWNRFTTNVNITKASFEGSLSWRYSGAMLYLTGSF